MRWAAAESMALELLDEAMQGEAPHAAGTIVSCNATGP